MQIPVKGVVTETSHRKFKTNVGKPIKPICGFSWWPKRNGIFQKGLALGSDFE
jgi:hypothetical protein